MLGSHNTNRQVSSKHFPADISQSYMHCFYMDASQVINKSGYDLSLRETLPKVPLPSVLP